MHRIGLSPKSFCLGLLVAAGGCGAPQRPESQTPFDLGREAAGVKDYQTAIAQLNIAINNAQDYVFTAAYLERGECHFEDAARTEDPAKREEHLKHALEDFGVVLEQQDLPVEERARALVLRGRTLLVKEDAQGAEESFRGILDVELPSTELHHRLEAHRQLGWILLERARADEKRVETAEEELQTQDAFRRAQDHFSRGLEIDGEDEECNLGKGICLHSRGQDREALGYLEKCTAHSEARGVPNHRGHYFLALALELEKGYQEKALERLRKAVEQDSKQAFTPLYAHLVEVLGVYVRFDHPQFQWFLDNMLLYAGDDRSYWESVEKFASRLAAGGSQALRETGTFALAIARARNRKVDAAVKDALLLEHRPDFLDLLSKIFPNRPKRPDYLYGRALALLGAKRHGDLKAFFEEPAFRSPEPSVIESDDYQRALVLEGKNIVASWLESRSGPAPLSTEEKLDRDRTLGRARDAFQSYLEKHPDDLEVRMALGEVQELMEAIPAAFLSYALLARQVPDHTSAFRRIVKLHSDRLLLDKNLTEAWIVLRGYSGTDEEVRDYLRRTQSALEAEALLYCRACGRKGAEGDAVCLECGRQIGRALARDSASGK